MAEQSLFSRSVDYTVQRSYAALAAGFLLLNTAFDPEFGTRVGAWRLR